MTEVEALKNTFTAVQGARAVHQNAPREIELIDGEKRRFSVAFGHWSKSAINNNTQIVFLILEGAAGEELIDRAEAIRHGSELWKITKRKSPAESGKSYWLLSVTLGGNANG